MKRVWSALLLLVFVFPVAVFADTDDDAASVYRDLGKLIDEMLVIFRAHRNEPDVAADKLADFNIRHKARIKRLNRRSAQLTKEMQGDPNKAAAMLPLLMPLMQKAMELSKLAQEMMQHPGFSKAWGDYQNSTK